MVTAHGNGLTRGAGQRAQRTASGSSGVGVPLTAVMTSAGRMPALAAGPPEVTETTPAPAGVPSGVVAVVTATPSAARPELVTCPVAMSCRAILVTTSDEMAKPMPGPPAAQLLVGGCEGRDAHDLAGQVDQGAAAVAGVDRGGRLDRVRQGRPGDPPPARTRSGRPRTRYQGPPTGGWLDLPVRMSRGPGQRPTSVIPAQGTEVRIIGVQVRSRA